MPEEIRLSNVDAIYAEYPFLHRIFPRKQVFKAYVSRWDNDLLKATAIAKSNGQDAWGLMDPLYELHQEERETKSKPSVDPYHASTPPLYDYPNAVRGMECYLLNKQGGIVAQVGRRFSRLAWSIGYRNRDVSRENLGQALDRIGRKSFTVHYAVAYAPMTMKFLKLPSGFRNAAEWLAREIEEDRQTIRDF